jgi:hypothetical protein
MPRHVSEIFAAGPVVDQVDDECPHDRTSLFDRGSLLPGLYFATASRIPGKGFVIGAKWFQISAGTGCPRRLNAL